MFSLPNYTGGILMKFWKNAMINSNNAAQSIVVKSNINITSFMPCVNVTI